MPEKLEDRVLSHDKQLVKIETILDRVASNQDNINDSILSIAINLAKITNIEENNKSSFDRVHTRIDNEVKIRDEKIKEVNIQLKILDVFSFLSKYPKITVTVCVLLYATAISDIRHKVYDTIVPSTTHKPVTEKYK